MVCLFSVGHRLLLGVVEADVGHAKPGGRDVLRGIVLVLIFTPWYTGDDIRIYAPAFLILAMDLLLEGAESGLQGGVALMFSSFFVLLVLAVRLYLYRRPKPV